ncbi:peptidase [Campylobacterota bacterium]|nr:peptidase [Campylobacterota bacterium]
MSVFDFDIDDAIIKIVTLLIAVIGHEIAHGVAALGYGDTTAKDMGRLSLNPIRHIDPVGTIVLPLMLLLSGSPFLFGWAKPVPINSWRVLERGQMAMVVVSLAGIAFNLALAFLASLLISPIDSSLFDYFLFYLIMWNVVLAVFNLLPIPPLDGSNAIAHLAAAFGVYGIGRFFERVGMWGMIVVVVILMTNLKVVIFAPMEFLIEWFLQ